LHLFGEILDDKMVLCLAGEMVNALWHEIVNDFPNVALHEFVIMLNHIHGIIEIVGADSISAQPCIQKNIDCHIELKALEMANNEGQKAEMDSATTLSVVMQSFKRYITIHKNGKKRHSSTIL
jgi:hypothetical protein